MHSEDLPNLPKPHQLRNVLDVLIIGAGPAGLSAALALGRVRRSAVILDSGEYRNVASPHVHTVPTHDHKNPMAMRNEMVAELKAKYKTIHFSSTAAQSVRETDGGVFEVRDVTGRVWKGRKVILATGSRDIRPKIPGYKEAWSKSIFHCLLCRGFEEFGAANAAALITSDDPAEIHSAIVYGQLARQFTDGVTILANGLPQLEANPELIAAKARGFKLESRQIKSLKTIESGPSLNVEFTDGSAVPFGFMVHHPQSIVRGTFAQQLELELTPGGDILVTGLLQETTRRGVFAAGDCATPVKQVAVGMGAGVTAGIGANLQIIEDDISLG